MRDSLAAWERIALLLFHPHKTNDSPEKNRSFYHVVHCLSPFYAQEKIAPVALHSLLFFKDRWEWFAHGCSLRRRPWAIRSFTHKKRVTRLKNQRASSQPSCQQWLNLVTKGEKRNTKITLEKIHSKEILMSGPLSNLIRGGAGQREGKGQLLCIFLKFFLLLAIFCQRLTITFTKKGLDERA